MEVTGTACPGCTVEIFASSANDGEGETYLDSDIADPGGAFTITVSGLPALYLTATATDPADGTSEFSAVYTATMPLLTTSTKAVDQSSAAPGEILAYTLTLSNTGNVAATASLTDVLPSELTWLGQYTVSAGTLTWDPVEGCILWSGPVDLDAPVTITFQVQVNDDVPDGTVISNTAALDNGAGSKTELGPATVTVTIVPPTDTTVYLPLVVH
jgi:uncharacterized repeat protein (TIGR01451 family)